MICPDHRQEQIERCEHAMWMALADARSLKFNSAAIRAAREEAAQFATIVLALRSGTRP
jgi:hypothetical protein